LQSTDINTDQRTNTSLALQVPTTYPNSTNQGYNYDIPVGFVALDKGYMVLTHPKVVNEIPFTQGMNLWSNASNYGATSATTNIYFTSTTKSTATFTDIDIAFKTSAVCLALPAEFYFTNNPTWNVDKNLLEEQNQTNSYDSVYVTEVGLYNMNNELIAIAKLDRPVEKTYVNLMTFNLDIDV
jgi:hypothetical protein